MIERYSIEKLRMLAGDDMKSPSKHDPFYVEVEREAFEWAMAEYADGLRQNREYRYKISLYLETPFALQRRHKTASLLDSPQT